MNATNEYQQLIQTPNEHKKTHNTNNEDQHITQKNEYQHEYNE